MGFVRKLLAAVLVLTLFTAMAVMPVSAAQMDQDGLHVELTTDREDYAPGDSVSATLTVTNRGNDEVTDLILEIVLPDGCSLQAGQQRVLWAESLAPGGELRLTTVFTTARGGAAAALLPEAGEPQPGDDAVSGLGTAARQAEEAGFRMSAWIGALCAGLIAALGAAALCSVGGRKTWKRIICAVLIAAMVCGMGADVSAAAARPCTIETETTVSVGGDPLIVRGRVGYRLSGGAASGSPLTLESDEIYFVSGQSSQVLFTVETTRLASDICLYRGTEQVGVLRDDGTGGDDAAGDGIYSCIVFTGTSAAGQEVYQAKAGRLSSNQVTLYHFAPHTAESAARAREVYDALNRALQQIEGEFAGPSGYIRPDQTDEVMARIGSYLEQRSGDILLYEVDETGAYIKLASGLTLMYAPALEGVSAGGSDVSLTFAAYQPHPDVVSPDLESYLGQIADEYDTEFVNWLGGTVTLDRVKSFGSDQVIVWNGHGGYGPVIKSFLASGEYFDWDAWWWDLGYFWDCVQDRILNRSTEEQSGLACFTHKFVSHYCGDLSNDLIILSACHSGQDEKLANAFRDKGAKTVVGFSHEVYSSYADNLTNHVLCYMTNLNEATGNYYTVSEAVAKAKTILGSDDLVYARKYPEVFTDLKAHAAEPVIFGDGSFRYLEAQRGTLSGRICDAGDRVSPIGGATVTVGRDGGSVWTATSDVQGSYSLSLPVEVYPITVSAPGYLDFTAYAEVHADRNTYLETYLMVAESEAAEGTASGVITNSLTGDGLGGVQIEVRRGWNNAGSGEVLATAGTDSAGQYRVTLAPGNYTLNLKKDGFIDSMVNIVVVGGEYGSQNGTMTPVLSGGDYRIVLSWAANPRDLDSHVVGTRPSGGSFHVYYAAKTCKDNGETVCELDVDDTNGYGPETVTLRGEAADNCCYYIHRYAGSGTVALSEAQVRVFRGEEQIAVLNVPVDQGTGDYWNVFRIVDGQLSIINTITASPETP